MTDIVEKAYKAGISAILEHWVREGPPDFIKTPAVRYSADHAAEAQQMVRMIDGLDGLDPISNAVAILWNVGLYAPEMGSHGHACLLAAHGAEAMHKAMLEGVAAKDAEIEALRKEVERLTRERDIAVGERVARSKTMAKLRDRLSDIRLDDEIDRVYFRSTNDADAFRDLVQEIEEWQWHDIMRKSQQSDPFEASREAHERAEKAETALASKDAEIERMREALECAIADHDEHFGKAPNSGHWTNKTRSILAKIGDV